MLQYHLHLHVQLITFSLSGTYEVSVKHFFRNINFVCIEPRYRYAVQYIIGLWNTVHIIAMVGMKFNVQWYRGWTLLHFLLRISYFLQWFKPWISQTWNRTSDHWNPVFLKVRSRQYPHRRLLPGFLYCALPQIPEIGWSQNKEC